MEWEPHPPPLEKVHPELGELLRAFCNGELKSVPVVGRNNLCPCGSGKKYKKCHGKT
jgi:preprotein translocase subunit SecA